MNQFNRPLSPHLSSYKPQISSLFSIFHRISGFFLSFCVLFNSFYYVFICSFLSFGSFYMILYIVSNLFIYIYYIVIITVSFHFFNGIRHLLWDFCLGLELNNLSLTAYSIVAIIFSLIFLFIFL